MDQVNGTKKIILSFLLFLALFIANLFVPVFSNISYTSRMWLILDICVLALSAAVLIKNQLPEKKEVILSFLFGLTMLVAYRGINFSSVKGFLITTACSLASFRIFSKFPANAIVPLKRKQLPSIMVSVMLGLGSGIVLGTINLFLGGQPLHFQPSILCFLTALSPAILEEVCYRLFIFAYCLYLLKGDIKGKSDNFWCYFMMVVPHVLIHIPDIVLNYGVIPGLVNTVLLSLLFGIPFAVLQRKRDFASAMIAHGTVDVIRFSFLGLPF